MALPENLLLTVCAAIYDPVTTTDELIPSGETSSYRSNPLRLSEFALSRKDPQYVPRAKAILAEERRRRAGEPTQALMGHDPKTTGLGVPGHGPQARRRLRPGAGGLLPAGAGRLRQPGPGVRHQALPLQCGELGHAALHRRRSWRTETSSPATGSISPASGPCWRGTARRLTGPPSSRTAPRRPVTLTLPGLTREERDIILAGCLINYYAK